MHLHGKQKQPTRLTTFSKFSSARSALLISTDVAARGLDFPSVDWVVQLDCPDDVDSYIHRVGRTARYQSEGKGLCLLCPSEEEGMVKRWGEKGLEVKKIRIKETKMGSLQQQLQHFAFKDPEIKYLGQRVSLFSFVLPRLPYQSRNDVGVQLISLQAFISYMRSVHLQEDKTIFDVSALPAEAFAASLGLAGAPQIKLLEKGSKVKERGPAAEVAIKLASSAKPEHPNLDQVSESDGEMQRQVVGSSEGEGQDDLTGGEDDDDDLELGGNGAETDGDVASVDWADKVRASQPGIIIRLTPQTARREACGQDQAGSDVSKEESIGFGAPLRGYDGPERQ